MSSPTAARRVIAERSSKLNGSPELKSCGVRKREEDTDPVTSNAAVTNRCNKQLKANGGDVRDSEVATFAKPEAQAMLTSLGSSGTAKVPCVSQEMQKALDAFAVELSALVAQQRADNAALREEYLSALTRNLDEMETHLGKKLSDMEQRWCEKMDELGASLKTTAAHVFHKAATKSQNL